MYIWANAKADLFKAFAASHFPSTLQYKVT